MTNQVSFLEPIQVQELMNKNLAYVIDVREPKEYAQVHISGVSLMALSMFNPSDVLPPNNKLLVLHCRSGLRCGLASEQLITAGYKDKIYRMAGGLQAWAAAGLPTEIGTET